MMYDPSGDIAGEESGHTPENDASTGFDQPSLILCDSSMTVQCAALRVKKSVFPSGEKVGEPSPPGPEITPGAKMCGVGFRRSAFGVEAREATALIRRSNKSAVRRTILISPFRIGVSVVDEKAWCRAAQLSFFPMPQNVSRSLAGSAFLRICPRRCSRFWHSNCC